MSVDLLEQSPKVLTTIPFRRDPEFVDRELLSRVDEQCSQPAGRTALVGLGGIGKSQLAIEYGYRVRERSPETWVFWVYASDAARFLRSFKEIAEVVKLPGRNDLQSDIFQLVYNWLRTSERKWLMIVDDVDDANFLIDTRQFSHNGWGDFDTQIPRSLPEYLPQSQNGAILLTSRDHNAALQVVEAKYVIQVGPMNESQAIELLKHKLDPMLLGSDVSITDLVTALEGMPLAIVQAAAYISRRVPPCSLSQYLDKFRRNDRQRSNLLKHEGGQPRRAADAKNSIIVTWQITFEHIRELRQSAANILSLMSFFDSREIPAALLYGHRDTSARRISSSNSGDADSTEKDDHDDAFENDISILGDFSLVSATAHDDRFEMHKLVQLATRTWLEENNELVIWRDRFIQNLDASFPISKHTNWDICVVYFPHVEAAREQLPKDRTSQLKLASILYKGARFAEDHEI